MKCPKCPSVLVEANFVSEYSSKDYYNRYYCFGCDTLFETTSYSGDFVEEDLVELGEIDYI